MDSSLSLSFFVDSNPLMLIHNGKEHEKVFPHLLDVCKKAYFFERKTFKVMILRWPQKSTLLKEKSKNEETKQLN